MNNSSSEEDSEKYISTEDEAVGSRGPTKFFGPQEKELKKCSQNEATNVFSIKHILHPVIRTWCHSLEQSLNNPKNLNPLIERVYQLELLPPKMMVEKRFPIFDENSELVDVTGTFTALEENCERIASEFTLGLFFASP